MTKLPEKAAVLIHLSVPVAQFWQEQCDFDASSLDLLRTFAEKIKKLELPVFLCVEKENSTTDQLRNLLAESLVVENPPYSHEIALLHELFTRRGFRNLLFFDSVFPLLDLNVLSKVVEIHNDYGADYSFGENLPAGIVPGIYGESILEAMRIAEEDKDKIASLPVPLASYVEKNLNNFHVEIHYELPDLRMLRLNFSCKNLRSMDLTKRVYKELSGTASPYEKLQNTFQKNPGLLYRFPSYVELEIFSGCNYECTFCYRQKLKPETCAVEDSTLDLLLEFLKSGMKDTSVGIGGQGEPLEHPKAGEIIEKLLKEQDISAVVLETNGLYLEKIFDLIKHPNFSKLRTVINLNSLKNYEQIHGTDSSSREKVFANLEAWSRMLENQGGENTYIQMLKITDNETEVDDIYELSHNLKFSFLLQKYNSYAGDLPEKRVSDMTPLERTFCWHLRRDMYIRANGEVLFCKQEQSGQKRRGKVGETSLKEMWNDQGKDWAENYSEQYPQVPSCVNCDEYFTFNL